VPPRQVSRVVGVDEHVRAERGHVARIDRQPNLLQRAAVEQIRLRLRGGRARGGGQRDQHEYGETWTDSHGASHSENWKRMTLVAKLDFDGSGPCDGSSSFSLIRLN